MIGHETPQDLLAVVDEIFVTMAGLDLVQCPKPLDSRAPDAHIVAVVQLFGEWQGAVRLDMSMELARTACANLTGIALDQLSLQDLRDAAGELANMTAGSMKTSLAPDGRLSLPSVIMGADFEVSLSQGTLVQACSFQHPAGDLTVSIIKKVRTGRTLLSGSTENF